jgi:hypothetical protein
MRDKRRPPPLDGWMAAATHHRSLTLPGCFPFAPPAATQCLSVRGPADGPFRSVSGGWEGSNLPTHRALRFTGTYLKCVQFTKQYAMNRNSPPKIRRTTRAPSRRPPGRDPPRSAWNCSITTLWLTDSR